MILPAFLPSEAFRIQRLRGMFNPLWGERKNISLDMSCSRNSSEGDQGDLLWHHYT